MTAKIFSVILSLAALVVVIGCGQQGQTGSRTNKTQKTPPNGATCTMIAAYAVSAYIPVPSGNPNGMKVKVSVDGAVKGNYTWSSGTAESQYLPDAMFSFYEGKLTWAGYVEKAGKYSITVTSASGSTATRNVTVTADECHVIGQVINF